MKHKTCKTCLWWWDLYDTGEWICYRSVSPHYHKKTENGCKCHEDSFQERSFVKLGHYGDEKRK